MVFTIEDIKGMMRAVRDTMVENKDYLIELDSAIGDGDLGLTMSAGFSAAVQSLESFDGQDIGMALMQAGMAMNNAGSSTMGTLVSSALIRVAKVTKGKTEFDTAMYVEMANAAVQGIIDRGKAKVGDKTILDALVPAVEALQNDITGGKTLAEAYESAYQAAEAGFERTAELVSQHGRGHYYGEKSKGKKDPGAAVALLATKALRDYFNN